MADEGVAPVEGVGTLTNTPPADPLVDPSIINETDPVIPAEGKDPAASDTPIEYDLKLPDNAPVDEALMGQYKELLATAKVPPETAQKLLDLHASTVKKSVDVPYDAWRETQKVWQAEIKGDPIYGGKNLSQNLASVTKMINSLGKEQADQFRQALDFTGAGNNPAVLRALINLSKTHSEGSMVTGGGPASPAKSIASTVYPTLN
jgi:hypothetical protein